MWRRPPQASYDDPYPSLAPVHPSSGSSTPATKRRRASNAHRLQCRKPRDGKADLHESGNDIRVGDIEDHLSETRLDGSPSPTVEVYLLNTPAGGPGKRSFVEWPRYRVPPAPARLDTDGDEDYPSSTASKSPLATPAPGVENERPGISPMPSQSSELAVSPYAGEHDVSRASPAATPGALSAIRSPEINHTVAQPNASWFDDDDVPLINPDDEIFKCLDADDSAHIPVSPLLASSAPDTPAAVEHEPSAHKTDGGSQDASHKKEGIVDKIKDLLSKPDDKEPKDPKK